MQVQESDNQNLAYYREAFSKIKVYKNQKQGGKALNQPIMLLSVIDLIAQGVIEENKIEISDRLIETFKKHWDLLVTDDPFENSDFALPFFHLKNAEYKFWRLSYTDEYDGGRPQTINTLRKAVNFAKLNEELFKLLKNFETRKELIDVLLSVWFSEAQKEIDEVLTINENFQNSTDDELNQENLEIEAENKEPKFYLRNSVIRDAFFRKSIVHLYDYKCAFCRLKVTKSLNQNIVDGAHIKPFAKSYNSKINNGISLCKNHHWAFDRGWFAIDDDYKILVTGDLEEDSPHAKPMLDFINEIILLPKIEKYFPSKEMLKWHRENIYNIL